MSSEVPTRRNSFKVPLLAAFGAVGAVAAANYARGRYQQSQLFVPGRYPDGDWDPQARGLPAEDRWFRSDGLDLHGWWMARPQAIGTVLFCHGQTGSIAHRIEVLQHLWQLPVNLFAFDYRGYGRSPGIPSEAGLFRDVRSAWRHLIETEKVSPESIFLAGHSLGGAVAIDAARELDAAGLIVQSSFTDVRSMARVRHPKLPMHWIAKNQFQSLAKIALVRMPKLFIHGTADETVPYSMGRELYQRALSPKVFYPVASAGHNDVHVHGGPDLVLALERFLRRCLA